MSTTPAPATTAATREYRHATITFVIMAAAAADYSMLQTLVVPALPVIENDLDSSPTGSIWLLSAFLLTSSVMAPISGRLGDMFGKVRVLAICMGTMCVGLLISAMAASLEVMVLGRAVQGCGAAVFALSFSIVRDELPPKSVSFAIAMISGLVGVGGGLGVVVAGPITDVLSYHWLFWLPLPLTALIGIAMVVYVPESPIRTRGKVHVTGAILLSLWLTCLLLGITNGAHLGWDDWRVLGLFGLAALIAVAWASAETRVAEPLIDLALMRLRGVWTVNVAAFLISVGGFTAFVLIPRFVENPQSRGFGFSASLTEAGLFVLPSTLAMLVAGVVSARVASRVGWRVPLLAGSLLQAVCFVLLIVAHDQPAPVYAASVFAGLGIGASFASFVNLLVEVVPLQQTGVANGMNSVFRTVGGAFGVQIAATILAANAVGGLDTERGFVLAFVVGGLVTLAGSAVSLLVPRPFFATSYAPV